MKKLILIRLALIVVLVLAIFSFGQHSNAASVPKYFAYVANAGSDNNISAYSINPTTGVLSEIKGSPFPTGICPSDIAIHPNGKYLYVANNQAYNITAYTINPNTGSLTTIKGSPYSTESPILIRLAPSGKFVYTANLDGDITIYSVNPTTGALKAIKGSPFHIQKKITDIAFDPTGKLALITDYSCNSIFAYSINDITGTLTKIKETPIKTGKYPGSITLAPNGKFAFVSNYDTESLSVYAINTKTGVLTEIKNSILHVGKAFQVVFALSGKFAYILSFNNIEVYSFEPTTGRLAAVKDGSYSFPDVNKITSLTIAPNHKFLYATNSKNFDPESSNTIYAFSINAITGKLTEIKGSPVNAGDEPSSIITIFQDESFSTTKVDEFPTLIKVDKSSISPLIENYEKSLVNAINTNNFSLVAKYLTPGSNLYKSQKDLVAKLYQKKTQEKLVGYKVEKIKSTEQTNVYHVYVTEKIRIKRADKADFTVSEYRWVYTVVADGAKYSLSDIAKWDGK